VVASSGSLTMTLWYESRLGRSMSSWECTARWSRISEMSSPVFMYSSLTNLGAGIVCFLNELVLVFF